MSVLLVVTVFAAVVLVVAFILFMPPGGAFPFHVHPSVSFDVVGTTGINLDVNSRWRGHKAIDADIDIGWRG
jgi:hypothetical protein